MDGPLRIAIDEREQADVGSNGASAVLKCVAGNTEPRRLSVSAQLTPRVKGASPTGERRGRWQGKQREHRHGDRGA